MEENIKISDAVMADIRAYQQNLTNAQNVYDAYVKGAARAMGIDLEKVMFDGNNFIERK